MKPLATYQTSTITLIGADAFGEISSGEIVLRGRCLSGYREGEIAIFPSIDEETQIGFTFWSDPDLRYYSPHSRRSRVPTKALFMVETVIEGWSVFYFLVLQVAYGSGEQTVYERIGVIYLRRWDSELRDLELGDEEVIRMI